MDFRIESERLILRAWERTDFEPFRAIASDPEVMRYVGNGEPWSDPQIEQFIARQTRGIEVDGYGLGALVSRDGGELVGQAGLQTLGWTQEVEIGWWLAKEHWGRGLATEVGHAIVRFAFERAGLTRVVAIAQLENGASIRVMEHLGMRFERRATGQELGLRDPDVEVMFYSIARDEWQGRGS
jgi:ribosomal-protein-alanine N-acetyltransferase